MKPKMLSFFYNNGEVNYIFNPSNANMMINATQMGKIFNKRVDSFLRNDFVREYIEILKTLPKDEKKWLEFTQMCVDSDSNLTIETFEFTQICGDSTVELLTENDIYQPRGKSGTWMHRLLAIEFAAWLEPSFKLLVNMIIENVIYGNYKKHFEAHALQEATKLKMTEIKSKLRHKPDHKLMLEYFECEETLKLTTNDKRKATNDGKTLFNYMNYS